MQIIGIKIFFHSYLVAILKTSVAQVAMENKDKVTVCADIWIQYKVKQIITNEQVSVNDIFFGFFGLLSGTLGGIGT